MISQQGFKRATAAEFRGVPGPGGEVDATAKLFAGASVPLTADRLTLAQLIVGFVTGAEVTLLSAPLISRHDGCSQT